MSTDLIYGIFFATLSGLFYILNKSWKKDRKNKDDGTDSFKIITLGDSNRSKIILGISVFISIFFLVKSCE